ncbi:hypothetical protein LTR70_007456 [Exophiala xenobiotica]|uniref:Uncharacterized protein n=1 Tax=Lithohypha guttulata TaxID=1690604 RepID=A0ABR0K4C9_9EURO|nr:hypothetical protein LTR24_006996 [Lithohypha guttulata]KAK5313813.1 hypothetical protein LTR70_007456 [Exophiala xenobiotica]
MQRECILVGELVVWDVHVQDIMRFYKIRSDDHDPDSFRIVGAVSPPSISSSDIRYLNDRSSLSYASFLSTDNRAHIVSELRVKALPTHLFLRSVVAEVIGAGFDRPANSRYWTLRFSRIVKVHHDRLVRDVVDSSAYQQMAQISTKSDDHDDDDSHSWLARLGYGNADSQSLAATTQPISSPHDSTSSTIQSSSPRRWKCRQIGTDKLASRPLNEALQNDKSRPVKKNAPLILITHCKQRHLAPSRSLIVSHPPKTLSSVQNRKVPTKLQLPTSPS